MSFTVRKHMKSVKEIPKTLVKLKTLGVDNLELAYIDWNDQVVEAIRDTCQQEDIKILSSQIKYKIITERYDEIVAYQHQLGCHNIAVSVLPTKYIIKGESGIRSFAEKLNALGERLKGDGLNLLYHHHHFEYQRLGNQTGLELLMAITNPDYVNLEMDVYWTQVGGKNPSTIIQQFASRIKVIHLRDYQVKMKLLKQDFVPENCSLGQGNLNLVEVVSIARKLGIPFLAFEENTKKPFEAIKISMDYLKQMGLMI